jgi:hypothetical protein
VHECRGGGVGCHGVDMRGGSGLVVVGPWFCQTSRESLAWIRLGDFRSQIYYAVRLGTRGQGYLKRND